MYTQPYMYTTEPGATGTTLSEGECRSNNQGPDART